VTAIADLTETDRVGSTPFAEAFERHAWPLLRYCACRVGPEAAEDVVAETFLIAYAQRDRFDPARASLLTWLYGIATNVARRHRRAESRRLSTYARAAEALVEAGARAEEGLADRAADRADARLARGRMARALARLPSRQREVILLYAVAELEYAEIAAALDIPIGTVQSALHRARTKLRVALGGTLSPEGQS
jgi:RNA polymerase sigma-70 factor (ECF subfamily)